MRSGPTLDELDHEYHPDVTEGGTIFEREVRDRLDSAEAVGGTPRTVVSLFTIINNVVFIPYIV